MANSNRPSKRAIPGVRPAYPANLEERTAALAYTESYVRNKHETREANMKRHQKAR